MSSIAPPSRGANPPLARPSVCPICGLAETWRPVMGFEDLYEISSAGVARTVPRRRPVGYGRTRSVPSVILSKRRVSLSNQPYSARYVLRRVLFLEHYSRAPLGAADVFKDGNRQHLCVGNLDWEFPLLNYRAMHQKVAVLRGSARDMSCVDCGSPAHDWSYTHSGYCETAAPSGVPYSLDVAEYDPRCRSCHRLFDKAGVYRERDSRGRWVAA